MFLNFRLTLVLICILVLSASNAQAQLHGYKWGLTPFYGAHNPALDKLNDKALKAPLVGRGTVRGEPGTPDEAFSTQVPFGFSNPLSKTGVDANVGLELEWFQTLRHSFFMGVSTYESSIDGNSVPGSLPLQGVLRDVTYDRRVDLSYNEFYFGWKYKIFHRPKKYRFYSRLSLNEVFDLDYREEHVFSIHSDDTSVDSLDGVKRIISVRGQTTGVLMFQFGLGGEYFLKKNISVGLEGSYIVAGRSFQFVDTDKKDDLQNGDDVTINPPVLPADDNAPLGYIPPDTDPNTDWSQTELPGNAGSVVDMDLRLDGWKAAFRITIYF